MECSLQSLLLRIVVWCLLDWGLLACGTARPGASGDRLSARDAFRAGIEDLARTLEQQSVAAGRAGGDGPGDGATGRQARAESEGSLTLAAAIVQALSASPELEQIARRIEAAAAQIDEAAALSWPHLVLGESYGLTDDPVMTLMHTIRQGDLTATTDFNDPGRRQDFQTHLAATWRLYDGGQRQARVAAAEARRLGSEADRDAARNHLVRAVIETYLGVHRARSFVAVMRQAVRVAGRHLALGRTRFESGAVLRSEVLRLETREAEARYDLVHAEAREARLLAALERLLARPIEAGELPDLSGAEEAAPVAPSREIGELVRGALERRPELRSLEALLEAAEQEIEAEAGTLRPTVDLEAGWQLDTERFDGMEASWMLGAAASLTLFEGGLTEARVRGARARLLEARARGRQLALDIALEVRQSWLAVREASESLEVARQRTALASEALGETRRAYESGAVTVEPLLQAELSWRRAEVARVAARFDLQIAQAALAEAVGEIENRPGDGAIPGPEPGGSLP